MTNYVGIDLGTTNSAICSFDGEHLRLYKSPEQHDVTPSAIFLDKRGNKYVGARAYVNAARNPDSAATAFKRFMGTSTPIKLAAVNIVMTPEECSAEILRTLFGYLPEEIRNSEDTGTVITVPAAFNQMQKDATMAAAEAAGIGRVALMQEPVAAVMSVMQQRKSDGTFLVYDLGGGTLDIAIAQSVAGRVSLLAHGGIAMCGGRDFDRALFDNIVKAWLIEKFDLPEDFVTKPQYKALTRMALWAAEKAKIELSSKEQATIALSENELGAKDESDTEIYLEIEIARSDFDDLVAGYVEDSIRAARDTLEKAGLGPHDVERVVFVGGPTHYKPLRDRVSTELGIAGSTDVNPMTAVAEGAAVFAESIDWTSQSRGRKSSRGSINAGVDLNVSFNYTARTPDSKAKFVVQVAGTVNGRVEFQVDSLDTGWSSGRMPLANGVSLDLELPKPGENTFKVFVFDAEGGPLKLAQDKIVISRTAASVDAIPASHSIGVEVRDKSGGRTLEYLVREGDQLPKKGRARFKSDESLRASGTNSIRFKLWEGDISDPITDNRYIGQFAITGADFEEGVIAKGADLICDYEARDSGNIVLDITVPSIGGLFKSGHNFYSRQEGQIDYTKDVKRIAEDSNALLERLEEMESKVADERFEQARKKLDDARQVSAKENDPELARRGMESVHQAKLLIAQARKEHQKEIRQLDLDRMVKFFQGVRKYARPAEESAFDSLVKTAQRSIDNSTPDCESHLADLRHKVFGIYWRQEWFVIDRFKWLAASKHLFPNTPEHPTLVAQGMEALKANDVDELRKVVIQLDSIRIGTAGEDDMLSGANIVRA
jgi:molecular chaperone DnaK